MTNNKDQKNHQWIKVNKKRILNYKYNREILKQAVKKLKHF